jgi:hypothetical protein
MEFLAFHEYDESHTDITMRIKMVFRFYATMKPKSIWSTWIMDYSDNIPAEDCDYDSAGKDAIDAPPAILHERFGRR